MDTPHGDGLTTALIPVADRLISAVHTLDQAAVHTTLIDACVLAGDTVTALQHLVVILAGMCSEDHTPEAALGWTVDPEEYQRLRSRADALTASLRAGRTAQNRSTT